MPADRPVVVVGAGISGTACARRLHDAGRPVRLLERAREPGGRMAVRTEDLDAGRHPVDIGAAYFTVQDQRFAAVVQGWRSAGLARPWTETFHLATPAGRTGTTTDPLRWSSPAGLAALVQRLGAGLDGEFGCEVSRVEPGRDGEPPSVDGEPAAAVVLAMPDPQAAALLPPEVAVELDVADRSWAPAVVVWATWRQRWWPPFDGVFVDGSAVLSTVVDDGRRRGDGAPVLVAHTTADVARARLDDVQAAVGPVLAELPGVLGSGPMPAPLRSRVHRWSAASPRHPRERPFALHPGLLGVCGDGWGPRSRVEQAWLSGHLLAGALLAALPA